MTDKVDKLMKDIKARYLVRAKTRARVNVIAKNNTGSNDQNDTTDDDAFIIMCDVMGDIRSLTVLELTEFMKRLTVIECMELVKAMFIEFDLASVLSATVVISEPVVTQPNDGQTEFDVILKKIGEKKVEVIKVVRQITGLGLKEAKDLVEGAPKTVKENVSREEAERIKAMLEAAGATVELK